MNSLPRRPNFVLAWIVVVMAVFSGLSELILGSDEDATTDRNSALRLGVRLDAEDTSGTRSESDFVATPADRDLRGAVGPAELMPPSGEPMELLPLELFDDETAFASEEDLPLPYVGDAQPSGADPAATGELPGATAVVPTPVGGTEPEKGQEFHSYDRGSHGGSGGASVAGRSRRGGKEQMHRGGGRGAGHADWQERMQLRRLPDGSIRIFVRLQGRFGEAGAAAWDFGRISSGYEGPWRDRGDEVDEGVEQRREAKQRIKTQVRPLLPALVRAADKAQEVVGDAEQETLLRQRLRTWVRERPGGVELVAQLDRATLERLSLELGPAYPQLAALVETLR
jgi:hypothetical protein